MSSKIQTKKNKNVHCKYTNSNHKNYSRKHVNVGNRTIVYGFLFYILFVAPSYGQEYSLGIKGGPLITLASFGDKDDKDEFSHEPKIGYYIAGLVSFPLKKN